MREDSRFPLEVSGGGVSRRELLTIGATAVLGISSLGLAGKAAATGAPAAARKAGSILFFTKSSGFEHSVIKRHGDPRSHAGQVLTQIGKKHDFEIFATKDGRIFDSAELDGFDAFFFYTSGDLTQAGNDKHPPMSPKGKKRLLGAVADGKGFIGSHCASDSFHTEGSRTENQKTPDPYIAMVGGEFISHGRQQEATMRVTSSKFPGCGGLGSSFRLMEEWYALKNFNRDMHVILVNETEGMVDWQYQRPPFPSTWIRPHGRGRVFYTAMGHREDVWTNPIFQGILVGGIDWTLGRIDVDTSPNIDRVTPGAFELPARPERRRR